MKMKAVLSASISITFRQ